MFFFTFFYSIPFKYMNILCLTLLFIFLYLRKNKLFFHNILCKNGKTSFLLEYDHLHTDHHSKDENIFHCNNHKLVILHHIYRNGKMLHKIIHHQLIHQTIPHHIHSRIFFQRKWCLNNFLYYLLLLFY